MTQFIGDSFSGADGTTLTTYSSSWARAGGSGLMALLGNRARQSGSSTAVYIYSGTAAPSPDYDVSANIYFGSTDGAPSVGVCGRMVSADTLTFYQARFTIGTGVMLVRFIANAATTLATVPYTPVLGTEPKLTLRQRGDQLSVLVNDVVVIGAITDTNIVGAGYAGIRAASSSSSSVHLDNFTATLEVTGTTVDATAAWVEAAEATGALLAATVAGQGAWAEQSESVVTASQVAALAEATWTETSDSVAVAASAEVRLAAGWNEGAEATALAGAVGTVNSAAIAWTEGGESPSIAAAANVATMVELAEQSDTHAAAGQIVVRGLPAWVEGSESFAAGLDIAAVQAIELGWAEQAEVFAVAATSAAQVFARAPTGHGYSSRRHEAQTRSIQISGTRPSQSGGVRPPVAQENNR